MQLLTTQYEIQNVDLHGIELPSVVSGRVFEVTGPQPSTVNLTNTGYPFIADFLDAQFPEKNPVLLEVGPSTLGIQFLTRFVANRCKGIVVDRAMGQLLDPNMNGFEGEWQSMKSRLEQLNFGERVDLLYHHRLGPQLGPDFFSPADFVLKPGGYYVGMTRWGSDNPAPVRKDILQSAGYGYGSFDLRVTSATDSSDEGYHVIIGQKQPCTATV